MSRSTGSSSTTRIISYCFTARARHCHGLTDGSTKHLGDGKLTLGFQYAKPLPFLRSRALVQAPSRPEGFCFVGKTDPSMPTSPADSQSFHFGTDLLGISVRGASP